MEVTLPVEFTTGATSGMVEACADCYEWVRASHQPAEGRGGLWAALTVASMVGPRLRATMPGVAAVSVGALSAEMRIGRHRIRVHKVGSDARDEIASSFPGRSPVGVQMAARNQQQQILGLPDIDQPVAKRLLWENPSPSDWVLGHVGNGLDGLQAVYLCVPWESDGRTITGWRGWKTLYHAAGLGATTTEPGLPIALPPAVGIDLPRIDLVRRLGAESDAG